MKIAIQIESAPINHERIDLSKCNGIFQILTCAGGRFQLGEAEMLKCLQEKGERGRSWQIAMRLLCYSFVTSAHFNLVFLWNSWVLLFALCLSMFFCLLINATVFALFHLPVQLLQNPCVNRRPTNSSDFAWGVILWLYCFFYILNYYSIIIIILML